MTRTYIIAEAGVNHNGSLEMAKELVCVAKDAGADAVKFQTFKAENLVTKSAMQANYQIKNLGETTSQYKMLKNLELSYEEFIELNEYCRNLGIEFISTPFDFESVDFLLDDLNIGVAKIPSGELTNSPFIHYIATRKRKIILSTGMATIQEIHEALSIISYGLSGRNEVFMKDVLDFYHTNEAKQLLEENVILLHCTTEYPASLESINLRAIQTLRDEFNLRIGLSDHSAGIAVSTAAIALGANVIEKHFTLDKKLEGPDHIASLEPQELKELIKNIREVELALGNGKKEPTAIEIQNRKASRRSLVAKRSIEVGDIFTINNLTVKRPGNGIVPSEFWNYIGKEATKPYSEDELIEE